MTQLPMHRSCQARCTFPELQLLVQASDGRGPQGEVCGAGGVCDRPALRALHPPRPLGRRQDG